MCIRSCKAFIQAPRLLSSFRYQKLPLLSIHDLCSHKGTFSAWFLFQPMLKWCRAVFLVSLFTALWGVCVCVCDGVWDVRLCNEYAYVCVMCMWVIWVCACVWCVYEYGLCVEYMTCVCICVWCGCVWCIMCVYGCLCETWVECVISAKVWCVCVMCNMYDVCVYDVCACVV